MTASKRAQNSSAGAFCSSSARAISPPPPAHASGDTSSTALSRMISIRCSRPLASEPIMSTGKEKQQDNGRGDGKQAGGRRQVTNGRTTAIDEATGRVEERQSTQHTYDHKRAQRPRPRP